MGRKYYGTCANCVRPIYTEHNDVWLHMNAFRGGIPSPLWCRGSWGGSEEKATPTPMDLTLVGMLRRHFDMMEILLEALDGVG